MPKRRAASRWLSPSTWQARRTRPSSSTENIPAFPGSFRTRSKKALSRYSLVPPRPDYPAAVSVAHFVSAALIAGEAAIEAGLADGPRGVVRRIRLVRDDDLQFEQSVERLEEHVLGVPFTLLAGGLFRRGVAVDGTQHALDPRQGHVVVLGVVRLQPAKLQPAVLVPD